MIQSISATRPAGSADPSLPTPSAAHGGRLADGRQPADDAILAFDERMKLATGESEPRPLELSVVLLQGTPAALTPEQGQVMQAGGDAARGAEAPQELTPEQWLLSMIDQQLATIQARDAGSPSATPGLVDQALSETAEPVADALLAWTPDQRPLADQSFDNAQADLRQMQMGRSLQGRVGDTNLLAPVISRQAPEMSLGQPGAASALAESLSATALEPLSVAEPLDGGEPLPSTLERGQIAPLQAADRALKLQAPETKWGEQMLHALRENVDLQIQQKIQSATIRLDPPELGSMEILLSHESGRLNVQLSAVNADVARLLQQTSDRLRQELVGQHFVQVNVQVGADSGGQQGQQRQRTALTGEELPQAARPHEQEQSRESGRPRDVLITV